METLVPDYYQFLNWHDLSNPIGIYEFIQEMLDDGIDLADYPEIEVYYNILCDNAERDEPNMITTEYVVKRLSNALERYGFAHTRRQLKNKLYYYWNERGG